MAKRIETKDLDIYYGSFHAVESVNLIVEPRTVTAFIGPSGCGKSTVLNIVAGLLEPSLGGVILDGKEVRGPGPDRSMVFQNHSLLPWLTVYENVEVAVNKLFKRSMGKRERREWIEHNLALVNMGHALNKYPQEISGGMKQRVGIARALAMEPKVLLMDEPFGALDAQTREVMHDLIRHVHRLEKSTILFVTHDVEEAIYLGSRIVLMAPRPGRIDSIYEVPLPAQRHQDMKLAPEFTELKREILARIRETSGMQTDLEQLARLSAVAG